MLTFGLTCTLSLRDHSAAEVSARAQAVVEGWLRAKEQKMAKTPRTLAVSRRAIEADGLRLWELEVGQPADSGGTWTTEIRCLEPADGDTVLTIVMRVQTDGEHLAPVRYYVVPPSFLRTLGAEMSVKVGGTSASSLPWAVHSPDQTAALVEELGDPARSLPLIVVTLSTDVQSRASTTFQGLAPSLSTHLFGLANVVELSRAQTFTLTKAVGKAMSVFDGGLRVYWPRWSPEDPFERHPLYFRRRLEAAALEDPTHPIRPIRSSLGAILTRAAAARFAYPKAMLKALAEHDARQLREQLRDTSVGDLREQVGALSAEINEHRGLAELAVAENSQLRVEVDLYRRELAAARKELERVRAELTGAQQEKLEPPPSPWDIEDPQEALERARTDFRDTLVIPGNLPVDTSQLGGWWYYALHSLHQLCELDRAGRATNKRDLLVDLLAQNGLPPKDTYKIADTGVTVVNPETRETLSCRERVHLVVGSPSDTESMYWVTLGDRREKHRYLLARIGRHA
jgi:hypothetical protein